jgi:hypothetical protein
MNSNVEVAGITIETQTPDSAPAKKASESWLPSSILIFCNLPIKHSISLRYGITTFSLLLFIYTLTFNGTFISDDEQHLISAAQNLAKFGELVVPQMYGNERLQGNYDYVEPAQAVLGAAIYKIALLLHTGGAQTIFLLNIYLTALTGVLVFVIVRVSGFRHVTALLAALAFGMGTAAWPYAETFFRDTLGMFFLTGAVLFLVLAISQHSAPRMRLIYWIAMGLFFVAGILTKNTIFSAAPTIFLVLILHPFQQTSEILSRHSLWGAIIFVGILLVPFVVSPEGPFYKFSWHYYYNTVLLTQFFQPHTALLEALVGPLLSPGKGIFFYSPVLFLAIPALLLTWKKHWQIHILAWGTLLGLIVTQALFYDDLWWGAVNWGLRYILPALPLMTIAAAPIIESLWCSNRWFDKGMVVFLISFGMLIQIGGMTIHPQAYSQSLAQVGSRMISGPAIWDPRYSAIHWHWRLIFQGIPWDIAWARNFIVKPLVTSVFLLGTLLLVTYSALGLRHTPSAFKRKKWLNRYWFLVGIAFLWPFAMLKVYGADPAYYSQRIDYVNAIEHIRTHYEPGDAIVVGDYNEPLWLYTLNYGDFPVHWFSLVDIESAVIPIESEELPLIQRNLDLFQSLKNNHARLWFVRDANFEWSRQRSETTWLQTSYVETASWQFSSKSGITEVYLFASSLAPTP